MTGSLGCDFGLVRAEERRRVRRTSTSGSEQLAASTLTIAFEVTVFFRARLVTVHVPVFMSRI
jgi:hypothetical protein